MCIGHLLAVGTVLEEVTQERNLLFAISRLTQKTLSENESRKPSKMFEKGVNI